MCAGREWPRIRLSRRGAILNRSRAPLRYVPWFIRDVLRFPGIAYLLLAIGMGYLNWRMVVHFGVGRRAAGLPIAQQIQVQLWNSSLTIAVLFAIGGVIGVDLQRGYYRSFFSKPMTPWWYYLQRYLLGGVMLMLAPVALGLTLLFTLHAGLGIDGPLVATLAMGYLLTGSACLLLSNFRPEAWLFVFLAAVAQNMVGGFIRGMDRMHTDVPAFMVWFHRLLPPFDLLTFGGTPLAGAELWHVLLYGAGLLIAALLLLRFRPLGSGGRS